MKRVWMAAFALFACGRVASQNPRAAAFVGAGQSLACALLSDKSVQCWGDNADGQLGNGMTNDLCTEDPRAPNCTLFPTRVVDLAPVARLGVGDFHACALEESGQVLCWGLNDYGQLGDGTGVNRSVPVNVIGLPANVIDVECGGVTSCALTSSGDVWCWGIDPALPTDSHGGPQYHADPQRVDGVAGAVQISVGFWNVSVRIADGRVQCWGKSAEGGTPFVSGIVDAVDISAGVIVRSNGSLVGCDATALGSGNINDAVQASTSGLTTCYRDRSGNAHCTGGFNGTRGDGRTGSIAGTFTDVVGFPNLVEISCGALVTCALDVDGWVRCWGPNTYGQVGDGTTTERDVPTPVVLAP